MKHGADFSARYPNALDLHSPIHRSFLYAHSGWFLDGANRPSARSATASAARAFRARITQLWQIVFSPPGKAGTYAAVR